MVKKILELPLSSDWRVSSDEQQWIVQKKQDGNIGKPRWAATSYVGSTKEVLLMCLKKDGAVISKAGQKKLDALPDTFLGWRDN